MICSKCGQERGLNFPPQKKHGRNGLHYTCRLCHAENARKTAKRGSSFINAIKNTPCMDCGLIYHPTMMDFDHRPGTTKLMNASLMTTWSIQKISEEIAKCDIVCVLCHRVRTWNRLHPDNQITRFPLNKDIVRTARRRAEGARNEHPRLFEVKAG